MVDTLALTLLWVLPLASAVGMALWPRAAGVRLLQLKALGVSVVMTGLTLWLGPQVLGSSSEWPLSIQIPWIPSFGVSYALSLDALSFVLILLNNVLTLLVVLISPLWIQQHEKSYYAFLFFLQAAVNGSLLATDLILFYIFWEVMLIPMAFLIGIFGSEQRLAAAMKFFLYTMLGGLTMLVAIIGTAWTVAGDFNEISFAYDQMLQFPQTHPWAGVFFACMALAFFIKIPLFPFYTWLPDAHTEAPAGGSVMLAGILLKLGVYGLIRFVMPIYGVVFMHSAALWALLGTVGVIWGGLLAWSQKDIKRLIACSSVSHMGFVVLGLFSGSLLALRGSLFQLIAHGLSTGALFCMIGIMYQRTHSRKLESYGGLAEVAPQFAYFFIFFALASAGLPGLSGFIGEFLILIGSFKYAPWLTAVSSLGVLLSAIYLLGLVQGVCFGPKKEELHFPDLNWREKVVLWPLALSIVVLGIYPTLTLRCFDPVVEKTSAYLWSVPAPLSIPEPEAEGDINLTQGAASKLLADRQVAGVLQ